MAPGKALVYDHYEMSELANYIDEIEKQIEVSRMLLSDLPERIRRMESLLIELKEHQSREKVSPISNSSRPAGNNFSLNSAAKAA